MEEVGPPEVSLTVESVSRRYYFTSLLCESATFFRPSGLVVEGRQVSHSMALLLCGDYRGSIRMKMVISGGSPRRGGAHPPSTSPSGAAPVFTQSRCWIYILLYHKTLALGVTLS
ncbi:hypothetical protein EVAR_11195_1 [Eumeta japonica]|uniref:Uncharacterized protein n=1 Tax=Eumeta variegata TaxID=151549 RepID=A0A4C1U5A9_EUMVA|nr:hypothetical protein EVAR_11195_1 [Eumeta japonica]